MLHQHQSMAFELHFNILGQLMNNHKRNLPFSCNPTDFPCPFLSLLRHLLKSKVLFLTLFGGLERYRNLAQPDTVEKCWTIVCETVKINRNSKLTNVKLGSQLMSATPIPHILSHLKILNSHQMGQRKSITWKTAIKYN